MIKRFRQFLRVRHAFFLSSLPFIKRPDVKFVIFAQGRTGSTLLVDLLNSCDDIHSDREILNIFYFTGEVIKRPLRYVIGRSKRFRDKVYGFKVKVYQLEKDHKIKDSSLFLKQLMREGFKVIHLRRENVLEHSFSVINRAVTGVIHVRSGEHKSGQINVPTDKLIFDIKRKIAYSKRELEVLEGIERLDLSYELDLKDSSKHLATINKIREYLGLSKVDRVNTTYRKINDIPLRDKISNFGEVENALISAGLTELLDHNDR